MNWFQGGIAEAVSLSKNKNAVFVVYVEGKDEVTQKLSSFVNEERIRNKLGSEDFVSIKINSDSEAYMLFAKIYQVVPIPSIFFIGKSGTPLEIGTGAIASVDELDQKIEKVLVAAGKTARSHSSTLLIDKEQKVQVAFKVNEDGPSTSTARQQATQDTDVVCDGDVCYKKSKDSNENMATAKSVTSLTQEEKPRTTEAAESNIEETRKLLEQRRRDRIEQENILEKERELQRRREGKQMQNLQEWQKEHELKELKENIRRDRLEEQAARERIRAQIAADRAERAMRFSNEGGQLGNSANATAPPANAQSLPIGNANSARLQFRLPNGESKNHTFECQDTFRAVRDYVKAELLHKTGIKDFIMVMTYPKREFTVEDDNLTLVELGLFPSAVILIISKDRNPTAIITRNGGLINMCIMLFWALMSPLVAVFSYVKNIGSGRGNVPERARGEAQNDATTRRNYDQFMNDPSTSDAAASSPQNKNATNPGNDSTESKAYRRYGSSNIHRLNDSRKDSDDENATWNGNSTQQQ